MHCWLKASALGSQGDKWLGTLTDKPKPQACDDVGAASWGSLCVRRPVGPGADNGDSSGTVWRVRGPGRRRPTQGQRLDKDTRQRSQVVWGLAGRHEVQSPWEPGLAEAILGQNESQFCDPAMPNLMSVCPVSMCPLCSPDFIPRPCHRDQKWVILVMNMT